MKKKDLTLWVAKETNMSNKDAEMFLNKMFEAIMANVKIEEVHLPLIGKLVVVQRKARMGRNPQTGEAIQIPASNKLKFKPSKEFKEAVK